MNVQDEITKIFQSEAEDLLKSAKACLLRLEEKPVVGPDVEELFRDFHTLKSSFAVVGFDAASQYIHMIENLLERVRSNKVPVTNTLVSLLLENVDFIHKMLNQGLSGEPVASSADLEAGKDVLERVMSRQKATRDAYRKTTIRVDVEEQLDHLVNLAEEIGIAIPRMQSLFSRGVDAYCGEIEQELENLVKINQDFQKRIANVRIVSP